MSSSHASAGAPAAAESTPLLGKPSALAADDWSHVGALQRVLREQDKPLAYTLLTTLATAPTLLFSSLHMVAFLKVHRLSASQVFAAHCVYMFWNTFNDVAAGYGTDIYAARCGSRLRILCGAQLLWGACTLLPFLPLPAIGMSGVGGTLYYLLCISLFDGCLSLVGVARVTLVAELTRTEGECVHLKRLNCVFGNVEALVSLAGYALWSETALGPFRMYLVVIVAVAALCCLLSSWRLSRYLPPRKQPPAASVELVPPLLFLRCLPRDCWVFIGITALHELQGVVLGQFVILALEALLVGWNKAGRLALLSALGAAAGITTFGMTWVADRFGLYTVLLWTFATKAVLGLLIITLTAFTGIGSVAICAVLFLNSISVAILAGFHFVIMVSLVDELARSRHAGGPSHPLAPYPQACGAAMLLGMSAFFVKPFSSVGPVMGAALFAGSDGTMSAAARAAIFYLLCALPLVSGVVQWALWSRAFTLRGRPPRVA